MPHIVVTGGSGRLGQVVIADLLAHRYDVLNVDRVPPPERLTRSMLVDLADAGQVFAVLARAEAVVHLAAIPSSGLFPEHVTFHNNLVSTYNVFHAAATLGLSRVVWASSVQVYGVPFDRQPPPVLPLDEDQPTRAWTDYPLAKILGEEMARLINARTGLPFVGLRLGWVTDATDAATVTARQDVQPAHLWCYVDPRDAARACRLALAADLAESAVVNITAADTTSPEPNAALVERYYPGTPLAPDLGPHQSLFTLDRARRLLGYQPQHSWRDPA